MNNISLEQQRSNFKNLLLEMDLQKRAIEADFRDRMVDLLQTKQDCFWRTALPAHFTGSALVISGDEQRVLLHHHKKLDRWLQFGGHCDGEADLAATAMREAYEESGIDNLTFCSRTPIDLDIHVIPARGEEPEHFHYDVRYFMIAPDGATASVSSESNELKWFSLDEIQNMNFDTGLLRMIGKLKLFRKNFNTDK